MDTMHYEAYHETKEHVERDFPFNVYLCTIPYDFDEVPVHWHDDYEMISIKRGRGKVSVDLTEYEVNQGDIVLIRPGQLHAMTGIGRERMEYENIIFKASFLYSDAVDVCTHDFFLPFAEVSSPIPALITPDLSYYKEVEACILEIDELGRWKKFAWQVGIKAALYRLFFILFHNNETEKRELCADKSYETLKMILKYLENNYSSKITIADAAAVAGYSESYFMKFFKTHMGMPFTAYLNQYRLTMAARFLTTSPESVLEIAEKTGFENLSYFNRMFRKKYEMTPSQYRKKHR